MSTPTGPFRDVYYDLIRDFPLTTTGYNSIFVILDKFTKMIFYMPIVQVATTSMLVQHFLKYVVCHYSAPKSPSTNHDTRFVVEILHDVGLMLDSKHHRGTLDHPQSFGMTKRLNQTRKAALRTMMTPPIDWDILQLMFHFAYNNAVSASTKY